MSTLHWIVIAIVCGVVEIATLGFWFLWLSLSALLVALGVKAGLLSALNIQLITFSSFTLLFIVFTRPLMLKFFSKNDVLSNVDALVGQQGQVVKAITLLESGQVKLKGEIWTAAADEEIAVSSPVEVVRIEGVKLIVKKQAPPNI